MNEKTTYKIRIDRAADGTEIVVDADTDEPIKGRITLAGMVLVGIQHAPTGGKALMVFQEP